MAYQVNWDNGASACGTFSEVFDTEAEAQTFGENWVSEMRSVDEEDYDGYTFEVIEVDDTPAPDPEAAPDNPRPQWA